jgi:hypothetical protein
MAVLETCIGLLPSIKTARVQIGGHLPTSQDLSEIGSHKGHRYRLSPFLKGDFSAV